MNIIELAKQAGVVETPQGGLSKCRIDLELFAELVAAQEREACAKLCDNRTEELYASRDTVDCADWLGNEIRARGRA